ncbi:prephenate dehydrogenase/arogenate dehydrogenase family protein [Marinicella sediminis]|uniref:chorismate mutase n=1 Tax=Marinicella sediminis TaxID=1792834 RepID=A0ABV7J7L8_9GAMM|nr:bifunctional chorismate mutase/prephenate dehydrogenase [Marinicella sediminis]
MDNKKLDQLRRKLDEIDEHIISLIAERQFNVEQIGNVKLSTNSPTRDYQREKQVIDKIRDHATGQGLDPEVAQHIFELIIETSLSKQEIQKVRQSGYGANKSALIIGGNGKMGQWFAQFLSSQHFDVFINDLEPFSNQDNFIADISQIELSHDYIIVATPIQKSAEILIELCDLQPSGIVLDISSIKSPLRLPLRQLADSGCRVVSIHPMFGPDIQLMSGKHVVFIDMGNEEAVNQVKQLFQPTMAERIDMKFEDHDRLIAYVLGLSHVVNIAFMTVLSESGEAADALAQLSSTTFDAQLNIAGNVSAENPNLYFEIQKLNHYSPSTLNALSDAVQRIIQMVHQNNQTAFVNIMTQARKYMNQRT